MSVLVFTENWDGKFKKLTFELVSYATGIANMIGKQVIAVSIGAVDEAELKKLGEYGASRVINVPDERLKNLDNKAYTHVISEIARKESASVIVLANNNTGKALAPRLSVKLSAGLISGVTGLPIATSPLTVLKKVFSGKAFSKVTINTAAAILTLSQNSFGLVPDGKTPVIEAYNVPVDQGLIKTRIKSQDKQSGKIILTDAEIVVSGGRGMKSPDNWRPLEELAGILGAALACSRPVSDEGWRPHEEHTGQTGKIIAPNLYLAFGISGAIQHLAGVSSSKCIVAINTDKDAPIFQAADYGIIGDAHKVLPVLIEEIRAVKNQ